MARLTLSGFQILVVDDELFSRNILTRLLDHMGRPEIHTAENGSEALEKINSPLKKASLTGFHATAKHIAAKAVSPSSETMRTI